MPGEGRYADTLAELKRLTAAGGLTPPPVEPPHAEPDGGGMESRVKRLEDDVRAIRGDLATTGARLAGVEAKLDMVVAQVAGLAGEVRNKVPGIWQLVTAVLALLVGLMTILGFGVKAAQWLRLIP